MKQPEGVISSGTLTLFKKTMPRQPCSKYFMKQLKVTMSRGPFLNSLWISYCCAESAKTNVEYATSNLIKDAEQTLCFPHNSLGSMITSFGTALTAILSD